jgi:hypothetical protein
MDLACQLSAFGSLFENKKKEMLTNSKIKDELALQNIGIANLTARLARQDILIDKIRSEMTNALIKANNFRQQLIDVRARGNLRNSEIKYVIITISFFVSCE